MDRSETVLITGASSGIGAELARLFAAEGASLILVARRSDRLEALASELKSRYQAPSRVIVKDLARPEAASELFAETLGAGWEVDVLVNNAGFGACGPFVELDAGRQLEMVALNVQALTHLTRGFLPGMRQRGRGGVLNVASMAAFQAGPGMAVYYATKAYVLHFTEALAEELRGSGVAVTCLAPGPTLTEFARTAGVEKARLFRVGVMKVEAAARAGHKGFRNGRTIVIPGFKNRLAAFSTRLVPRSVSRKVAATLNS